MRVNKDGPDWLMIKKWLDDEITKYQEQMLASLPPEEYHRCRGSVLLAKELKEWVEPTTPPKTEEEDYGISNGNEENYR